MTFDPTSVEVTCVTLPKDHCVQVPWEYINVCGYSDEFCKLPHTYTHILRTYYVHTTYYILHTTYRISDHIVSLRRDKKWSIHTTWPNLVQNFNQNDLIFFSFLWANFGSNFRKIWKIDPFIYQILHKIRGHCTDIPGGWFCYPCWQRIPKCLLYWVPPPPSQYCSK